MPLRCLVLLTAACLPTFLLPGLTYGHADYEYTLLTVQDRQGNSLTLVRHVSDGIVAADPSKLVIYGPNHVVVAETAYFRDVLVYQAADGTLYLFGVGWLCVLFSDAWVLRDRELAPVTETWVGAYAFFAQIKTHQNAYIICVVLCLGAYFFTQWSPMGRGRSGLLALPLILLFLILMYGCLSVLLILVLVGLGVSLFLLLRRAYWGVIGTRTADGEIVAQSITPQS